MMRIRHKKCIAVFKGILVLVGIAVFIAQLSCKFYQYASIPVMGTQGYLLAEGRDLHSVSSLLNRDRHEEHLLSLDKRYDLKTIFYLPASCLRLASLPSTESKEINNVSSPTVSRPNLLSSLRAPPSVQL